LRNLLCFNKYLLHILNFHSFFNVRCQ
jgi:hypothetical protein